MNIHTLRPCVAHGNTNYSLFDYIDIFFKHVYRFAKVALYNRMLDDKKKKSEENVKRRKR